MLYGRQRLGLIGGDQGALGDRRSADAAADRRGDARVSKCDPAALHGSFGGHDVGFGLTCGRGGILEILRADRIDLDQFRSTFEIELRSHERRLRARQCGVGAVVPGSVGCVFELVERLVGLDQAAFGEQAALDDTADLRAHLGHQEGDRAPRQFAGQHDGLRFHGDHADGDGASWRRRFDAAGSQGRDEQCRCE